MGLSMTEIEKRLKIALPTVSGASKRGASCQGGGFGYREFAECEYMKGVPLNALERAALTLGKNLKVELA